MPCIGVAANRTYMTGAPQRTRQMTTNSYHQTKTALLALGGQRVWSLMVTLFGDLAQTDGSTIEGPVLSSIMAEMDVRPEAVRVALHRLRNDGWIASTKYGRTGRHGLTPTSRIETRNASTRVYASPPAQNENWLLALTQDTSIPSSADMGKCGFAALLPRVYLGGIAACAPKGVLTLEGTRAPDWLREQISSHMLQEEYSALLPALEYAAETLHSGEIDTLQTAALRCLIVHNWRRIVLRHPALPRKLLPDTWAGHRCHVLVDTLLTRFPRPALSTIKPT